MSREKITKEYDDKVELYQAYSMSMKSLISSLLNVSDITPHSISERVKDRASLITKVEKKAKYNSLSELTDVVGIRIISHYCDEVDQIASLIEKEFKVDEKTL